MSDPDRHHHVPQFLLREWANSEGRVPFFLRERNAGLIKSGEVHPKNTAVVKGLYALEDVSDELKNDPEVKFFQKIDSKASLIHKKLLLNETISKQELQAWCQFIFVLRMRTPEMVQNIKKFGENILSTKVGDFDWERIDELEEHKDTSLGKLMETLEPGWSSNYGLRLLMGFMSKPEYIDPLVRMHWWTIDTSSANREVLLSDQPVFMSSGFAHRSCLVALPLSSKTIYFSSNNPRTEDLHRSLSANVIVRAANQSVVQQATYAVYGKAELSFVRKWMATVPSDPLSGFEGYLHNGLLRQE